MKSFKLLLKLINIHGLTPDSSRAVMHPNSKAGSTIFKSGTLVTTEKGILYCLPPLN